MADSTTFDATCSELEALANFDRLTARGTIRIAVKTAGLDPKTVAPREMRVVVDKLLEAELASRGVEDPDGICRTISKMLGQLRTSEESGSSSPDAIFARLGGES